MARADSHDIDLDSDMDVDMGIQPSAEPLSRRAQRRRRRSTERGATLVEYALLIAALVIPTIGAVEYMHDGAEAKIGTTATRISHTP